MTDLQIGEIRIDRIVEMTIAFDFITKFFPNATKEQVAACKPELEYQAICPVTGKINLVIQSYLVRTPRQTILIDTCVGCNKNLPDYSFWHQRKKTNWLDKLNEKGVSVNDVDIVLCTHLHCDHNGWNTHLVNGIWIPTFPNAKYLISDKDYENSRYLNSASYKENILPIVDANQAQIVATDHVINDSIWLEPTPGHTPGHVSVGFKSGDHEAVMCGDVMHSPLQCRYPDWVAQSDAEPTIAIQTRKHFLNQSVESQRTILTSHFPEPSMGKIIRNDKTFQFVYIN